MTTTFTAKLQVDTTPSGRGAVVVEPDRSWRTLYRIGGMAALLATLAYVIATAIYFVVPPPPEEGGGAILDYIAAHRTVYIVEQALWLAPSVLLTVAFLALAIVLKDLNKNYAAIGGVLGVASWVLTLVYPATGGGAPALIYLSDRYIATGDSAQRAAFAAAAEVFVAQNIIPTAVGILEPVSILILALVMLRGIFHRGVAYLGIATGAIGVFSEALRPMLGLGYLVYGLLLFAWFIAIGWSLFRLAGDEGTGPR